MLNNLDKKDIAILRELDLDVRASAAEIGRKVRLSKEVVQYRIKRLEEDKIITGYYAFTNIAPISAYKLLIKNRTLSGEKKNEFIDYVKKNKNVAWFSNTEGNFDFVITLLGSEDNELIDLVHEIMQKYGKHFQNKHILKSYKSTITNEKYLSNGKFLYEYPMNISKGVVLEDDIERTILTQLSLNARIRFTELAKICRITPEAIAQRYKKIIQKKVINRLKIRLNLEKLGLSYYHVFIALQNPETKRKITEYYKMHPAFNAMMEHIGYYDLHIEFMTPECGINEIIDDFISRFGEDISSYELLHIREEYVMNILK